MARKFPGSMLARFSRSRFVTEVQAIDDQQTMLEKFASLSRPLFSHSSVKSPK
jgi:hypothetical protein